MIKNTMLARNRPKGKEPILTMAMQMAGGGGGGGGWAMAILCGRSGISALNLKNSFKL